MKLKQGFLVKELAGEIIAVAVDPSLNVNGTISLNKTAKTLWLALEEETDEDSLVKALLSEYEVDEALARKCTVDFVAKLRELGFLEN